jgi:hypothetical protein
MLKRSKTSWAMVAPDYGRTCAAGDAVDLGERLPGGGVLADLVRPEWFEDLDMAEAEPSAPVRRRVPAKPAPVEPAAEQE